VQRLRLLEWRVITKGRGRSLAVGIPPTRNSAAFSYCAARFITERFNVFGQMYETKVTAKKYNTTFNTRNAGEIASPFSLGAPHLNPPQIHDRQFRSPKSDRPIHLRQTLNGAASDDRAHEPIAFRTAFDADRFHNG
jgi:hypothetical protein